MDKETFLISRLNSKYIGDDAAVIGEMVYSADAFCEGTHFRREWMSPAQIGRKAMLINLSDAVAMNADPLYALVSVMVPRGLSENDITQLTDALEMTAGEYGCEIIGGDTVGGEALHLSITLISRSDAPLMRSGLKPGDLLAYTGALGESKRDLEKLLRGEKIPRESRFYEPVLRREFVAKARPWLRAGMDISDGLYCDTGKMLDLNGLGLIPLIEIGSGIGESGEEYEMLVAFPPENREVLEKIGEETQTPLHIFAEVGDNDFRYPCKSHHF